MIKKIAAMLLCVSFIGGAWADPIDDYLIKEMERQQVPGLALVVMKDGQPVRMQSYGLANLEHAVPVRQETLFKTGAVGMQLTATAVMLLVDDGKMRLDDSVRKYLPEAPKSWQPVTIRQMLHHTSGLPATPNGDFRAEYTDEEFLKILYKQDLNFTAGTRWRFSYVDYVLLGFIIKRVTGEFYADLLTKRVFSPLGMNTARPINELAVTPNRAAGYEWRDGELKNAEWISNTANSTADGSLYLSPLDYAALEAGIVKRAILKPESWAAMGKPARLASGTSYPYGFGWYLEDGSGQQIWRHTGSWQGFQTSIIRYLGDGLTIVVLANGENGNPAKMSRHVAAMLDAKFAQQPAAPLEDREPKRTNRVKTLLVNIAEGKAAYGDFTQFAKLDFKEGMAVYQGMVDPLGSLQEVALFERITLGDDAVYHYRGRYEKGVIDVRVGFAPNGKIGNLDITPVDEWQAPLQD